MPGLSLLDIARAVGGDLRGGSGDEGVSGVVVDSRKARQGDLFVALAGARTDGHAYLREVQQSGAVAALVLPDRGERPAGLPCIVVPDTLAALAALARFHLGRLSARVIGVTGSVGKTTAKDFLHCLLGGADEGVYAAPASYNSECGLPLAILGAPLATRLMVLEYGVNAPGEMDRLLAIARPHHTLITALTPVHLEGMGSLETIVAEKLLLAAATRSGGWVWVDAAVRAHVAEHALQWKARMVEHPPAPAVSGAPGAWQVEAQGLGLVELPVVAAHEIELALRCAQAARQLGVETTLLHRRLAALRRPVGRLEIHQLGGVTVLDDAYNASPAAMSSALQVLRTWPSAQRRMAVLGTMHELGPGAAKWHQLVGREAAEAGLDALFAVGAGGAWIARAAQEAGLPAWAADDVDAVATLLVPRLRDGDVVLLKASRSEKLERLLEPLRQGRPQPAPRSEESSG